MKREQEQSIKNAFVTMLNRLAFMPLTDLYIEMLAAEEAETAGPEAAAEEEAAEPGRSDSGGCCWCWRLRLSSWAPTAVSTG